MGVFIAQQTTICLAREKVISDQYIKYIWLNSQRVVIFEPVEFLAVPVGQFHFWAFLSISEYFTKWEGAFFQLDLTSALCRPLW